MASRDRKEYVAMQNYGRYKYARQQWKHQWTPLSSQHAASNPGERWCSGDERQHPVELWGDSVPLRLHGDASTQGGGRFRGRDCIG